MIAQGEQVCSQLDVVAVLRILSQAVGANSCRSIVVGLPDMEAITRWMRW